MLGSIRRHGLRHSAGDVLAARGSGTGVYLREWRPVASDLASVTSAAILEWCRETVAATRRPWGIAQFDLALVAVGERGTLSLPRLTPGDLYPGDLLRSRLERFVAEHGRSQHLAAGLYSWGDAASLLVSPARVGTKG